MNSEPDNVDLRSMLELEYIAGIYMQHGELDKAAEIMGLAETIGRRINERNQDNVEFMDRYRPRLKKRNQA
jgi:hypothetical protein